MCNKDSRPVQLFSPCSKSSTEDILGKLKEQNAWFHCHWMLIEVDVIENDKYFDTKQLMSGC